MIQISNEERLNVVTHAIGLVLAIIASSILLNRGFRLGSPLHVFSYLIYCTGLILLYLASTLYHSAIEPLRKRRMKIFDHSAIYLLIAGTYTPIALLTVRGMWGITIFGIIWLIAAVGILFKLKYTGRFSKVSTITYVLMGWIVLIAIKPLINNMIIYGLLWLLAGGIFYTTGALIYQRRSMKFNHVVFHIFVVLGSVCHYIAILNYTE